MTEPQSASHRYAALVLILLPATLLLLRGGMTLFLHPGQRHEDLNLYFVYGQRLLRGEVPYRDFRLEYPPLALLSFVLPLLLAGGRPIGFDTYAWLYLSQNVGLCLLLGGGLWAIARHSREHYSMIAVLAVSALSLSLSVLILPWRYDIFPALLTLLALRAAQVGRAGWAGAWLGLGVAAKLYPIVLMPIFGLFYLARAEKRQLRLFCGGAAAIGIATVVPLLALAPHHLFVFLQYNMRRGLQIETLPGGLILLRDSLIHRHSQLVFNFGSWNLVSPLARPILKCLPWFFALIYIAVLWLCRQEFRQQTAQGGPDIPSLATWTLTALLAFIAANKVFSPQYVIWLLPFIPLAPRRYVPLAAVMLAATALLFPLLYTGLLNFQRVPILVLNIRNGCVAALLAWLLLAARRRMGGTGDMNKRWPRRYGAISEQFQE